MPVSAQALGEGLAEIVGSAQVLSDRDRLAAHAVDGVVPRWVVRPASTAQVSRLLTLASAERLAVIPRGSGSSLGLGAPPLRLDLVMDCRRLDQVLDYVPEDMVASVQAGVSLAGLAARLEPHRQRLPVDPSGGGSRTVGGVLATGASGPLRFRYGGPRDLLLGVRFAQVDGTLTWGGSRVVKSVSGYDVPKLLVGSLGTLAVITEATVRLHPEPPAAGSWLAGFATHDAGAAFVGDLVLSTIEPDRVAVLSRGALAALGLPGHRVGVAVSVASVAEAVATQGADLGRLAAGHGGQCVPATTGFWARLHEALEGPVALRLAGEPRRLVSWLGELERRAERLALGTSAVGEARSGVLSARLSGVASAEALRDLATGMREALAAEGGSLVLERLPAPLKAVCDVWGPVDPIALTIMERLKREFDPAGILSPGRFVGGL